jgi:hypothetical protein
MSAIQSLAKSAENNHGISLQPIQVKEVMDTLVSYQNAYQAVSGRLESLTYISTVLIERLGGKVNLQSHELDDASAGPGFDVSWDEETDVITIRLSEVAVPEVQLDDGTAEVSGADVAPVPEESEAEPSDVVPEDTTEAG